MTPWFHGWNVLTIGIFTSAVVIGIMNFSFTFYVVEWVAEFESSRAYTLLALSAAQISAGLLFPFAGRAMDKYPIPWVSSLGIGVFACALVGLTFAQSVLQIIIIYGAFVAAADAMGGPLVAQTLASKWFVSHRGLAIGLAALGTSIGGFMMPPVVAWLIVEYGWRTANLILAPLMVLATVPWLFLIIRGQPVAISDSPSGTVQSAGVEQEWTTRQILSRRSFWLVVIAFLPLMEITTALISNLALWTTDLGLDTQRTAFLMSVFSLMMISGKIVFGYLADRIHVKVLFYSAVALLVLALALMIGKPGYALLFVIVILIGLSVGGQMPLAGILINRLFGSVAFGAAMGLFYLCIRPVAFGGPIGGWVRDYFGSYDFFWIGAMLVILIFTPVLYFIRTD